MRNKQNIKKNIQRDSSGANKICDKMPGNRKTDVRSLEFISLNYGKLCAGIS